MTFVIVSTALEPMDVFDKLETAAIDLRPAWLRVRDQFHRQVEGEFANQSGATASGRMVSWAEVKQFGNVPPPAKILQRSGLLLRSLLGQGAGAIEEVTATSATMGVRGSVVPYAAVHRGSTGAKVTMADARRPAKQKVTPKMRGFLAAAKGVFLRSSTKTLTTPRRPFASWNPTIQTQANAILVSHVTGRATPFEGSVAATRAA